MSLTTTHVSVFACLFDSEGIKEKFLVRYCFDAAYVVGTLTDGFHFNAQRPIYFQDDIGGTGVSWALGAILYQVGMLPVTGSLIEMESFGSL